MKALHLKMCTARTVETTNTPHAGQSTGEKEGKAVKATPRNHEGQAATLVSDNLTKCHWSPARPAKLQDLYAILCLLQTANS